MNTKKITASIVSLATASTLLAGLAVLPAHAEELGLKDSTKVNARVDLKTEDRLPKIISRSNVAIDARVDALNKLNARIQQMKNVSVTFKSNISSQIQTNILGLTTLKTKIDADTDVTIALTDEKSILGSFRIYALVIPQGYILASADRVDTVVSLMSDLGAKLQLRITAGQTAGKDVSKLQASLNDFNSKTADAKVQSNTAVTTIASLSPDQGDKIKQDANTTALKAARSNIKTATQDLRAAHEEVKTIIKGLKDLNLSVDASSSARVSQ